MLLSDHALCRLHFDVLPILICLVQMAELQILMRPFLDASRLE